MEIPVRQLECCSGDLADLKVKSCDIEAWRDVYKRQMFHVKHSLLLQKLAGGQVNIIDMQKLLITGFRGIGDGERIAYDERCLLYTSRCV